MEEKKKSWFRRHKIITGIIVLVVLFGIIGAGGSKTSTNNTAGNNQAANEATTQQTATVVEPLALIGEYDKNKIAAQDKYTNKLVQLTAYVSNISNDVTGKYYLSLHPTNEQYYVGTSITCYFADKSAKSEITSLENGQSVTVQGTMGDMSLGIVVMNNCKVVQ